MDYGRDDFERNDAFTDDLVLVARLYAHAGEKDRALEWLEKAFERREPPLVHVSVGWDWESLRDHPRFQTLLRRIHLPE